MYIDNFHFSPFEIKDNVMSIYNSEFIIKNEKIFHREKQISNEEFYDLFVSQAKDTWFVEDFIKSFKDRKAAIPDSISYFAVYCDYKFTFLFNGRVD